jgi:hypothetical protein
MTEVKELERNAATRTAAAEAYLQLFEEARAKRINIGTDTPDVLLINAGLITGKPATRKKNWKPILGLALYPNHASVIPYLQVIADDHLAKGDTCASSRSPGTFIIKTAPRATA